MGWCPACAAEGSNPEHRRTVEIGLCPKHYMREYRQSGRGLEATRTANAKWQRRWWAELDEQERYAYGRDRRERTFQVLPETVRELRQACKRLEGAVAYAANRSRIRGASQLSGYLRAQ